MNLLKNQKVFTKVMIVSGILFLLNILVGGIGFYSAKKIAGLTEEIFRNGMLPIEYMDEVRLISKDTESKLLELIQLNDAAQQQAIIKAIDENTKAINKLQEQYKNVELSSFQKEKFAELEKELPAYRKARSEVIALAIAGKKQEAFALYEASKPIFAKSLDIRAELAKYNQKQGLELNQASGKEAAFAITAILGVTVMALLLLGILSFLLAKSISAPIGQILAMINEIASGNFRGGQATYIAKDEVGLLAVAVTKMRENVRELIRKTNQSTEQVAASSQELSASAEQTAQASTHIAQSISNVAAGAEKQLIAVDATASVVKQMLLTMQQIGSSTATVTESSAQSANAAQAGSNAVNNAIKQMGQIEAAVTRSAQVVAKLGDRSKEIGQIVDAISNIAGQTNLLALNAAIEAARAGDLGRGFAVVAEEVRKLAEQSQEAAKQIAGLISEIQQDTNSAVIAMNEGTQEVRKGSEVVNAAGGNFQEIYRSVNSVSQQLKDISSAIQQAVTASQQIESSVREIEGVSREAAGQSQSVSAATEQQSATMEQIAASSQALATLAEELTQAVNRFKV